VIDIHHHCLPGVDDGPSDWNEALDLCRMAADDGIETIIATPHVLRGRWQTTPRAQLESLAGELQSRAGDSPRVLLGSEYFFGHDMHEVLASGTAIIPLAGSRYVLVELVAHAVPPMFGQALYQVQLDGWIPVLAHPERNAVLQSRDDLLSELVGAGMKTQITAGSLTGEFGEPARRAALRWIDNGLVHFVASDAHNTGRRPPRMRAAVEILRQIAPPETVSALTVRNPASVLAGAPLAWDPEPLPARPRKGFFARVRELMDR
jgi:protein-tyrosine phosphatase